MKKIFTFLSVGVTALALSAVAVGQMKKARVAYGAPPKVEANGGMLSAKVARGGGDGSAKPEKKKSDADLTELQKIRFEKMSKTKRGVKTGKPLALSPAVKRQSAAQYASSENAKITLDVQMDWGDGSGYQLLLDADHNACGEYFFPDDVRVMTDGYDEYEYKLPSDAKPDGDSSAGGVLVYGDRESIEIPAGTYDYVVGNPMPSEGIIYIANGEGAYADDFEFKAGVEYVLTVGISENMQNDYCTMSVAAPVDLAVVELVSPVSSTELGASEDVTVRLRNNGTDDLQSFDLTLTVDDKEIATETVSEALASGAVREYTFAAKADLSASGSHSVKVEASVDGDADGSNNSVEKEVLHLSPFNLPLLSDFSNPKDVASWQVVDGNGDGTIWHYDSEYGGMYIGYNSDMATEDYLVTIAPVILPAGDCNISVSFRSVSDLFEENMRVLYGKSSNPDEMEVIGEIIGFTNDEYEERVFNFVPAEAGEYYFAVEACSEADQFGLIVNGVNINEGRYVAAPDLSVDRVILPMSSTSLSSQETVKVQVSNPSSGEIEKFGLSYTVNDGASVSQDFGALAPGESMVVEFDEKADFSSEGTYEVYVVADNIVAEMAEEDTENNTAIATTIHYSPADVPFTVDFTDVGDRADWAYEGDSWSFDDYYGGMLCNSMNQQPLISRGINLEAGKAYRFRFDFMAGTSFFGMFTMPDDFKVLYGKDGTPVDGWTELKNYEQVYTEEAFVYDNVDFTCTESGVYSIAIVPVYTNGTFTVASTSLTEKLAYDASLASVSAPSRIPAGQASKFTVTAKVANEGSNAIEAASVVVKNGEAEVGRASVQDIAVGTAADVPVEVALADAAAGSVANLEVSVAIDGHENDDTSDDNSASKQVSVTEEELGYDYVTEDMYIEDYCIGADGGAIGCGVPFHLAAEDVLTGISLGWGAADGQSIQIAVYEYDPATLMLGNEIFSEVVPQGTETGQIVYEISPRKLEAGDYMASVVFSGFCLVTNMDVPGMLYLTSGNPVGMQNNLGTPAIRTVFGEGEVVLKDAVVAGFSKPADSGLFSTNEPVVVSVKNDGYEEITGTLALSINGENAGSQSITLGGYASAEFTFEADLSKPGEYVLEAVATVEGDVNADNNSASKTVVSVEPADPYVMDFEQCEDFATSGFNPAWRTVDVDGDYIYGFQDVSFPAPSSGKAAYIVFNPALTTPSLEDQAAIAPHGGERFAACFAASGDPSGLAQNNDWLISPKLTLPATDAKMSFFVKSYTGEYGLEKYNVLVSETDDNIESFKMIGSTREAPEEAWTEVSVDLSEYAGKDVYLAIQCVSEDAFVFMLDDIKVNKPVSSVAENAIAALSLYPNPATEMIVISSGGSAIEKVDIYNAAGALVYSAQSSDSSNFRYNVSSLEAGIYFAKVETSDGAKVIRFIVK